MPRLPLRTRLLAAPVLALPLAVIGVAVAQSPPPRPLPPGITGATPTPPPASVRPATGEQVAAPVGRFLADLHAYPAETNQAVVALRSGAEWLWKMNQPGGRFVPGVNAAWQRYLDPDAADLRQAQATLALAEAAAFTRDDKLSARANGAVLALLSLTKVEADCRVPIAPSAQCNRVGFASTAALAIYRLPAPDARQLADAELLCAFLRKQCRPNGAVNHTDAVTDEPHKVDPDGVAIYPGMALDALLANQQVKPDAATRDLLAKAVAHYRTLSKAQPSGALAASLLPAFVEVTLLTNKDPGLTAATLELADYLCACQYTRSDTRSGHWVGGFRANPAATNEPSAAAAGCVAALCAAAKLTRQIPDAARFHKYRGHVVEGLRFVGGLQYTADNTEHFEKVYRTRFLVGGCRIGPADGVARLDATAGLVCCLGAYLRSGAEGKVE